MALEELVRDLELPSVYRALHPNVLDTLAKMGFQARITEISGSLTEKPEMISRLDDDQVLRATRRLMQGRKFIEMGIQADDEIKPLLLYYGLAQGCGFFVASMCNYPLSKSHGISIDENLNINVRKSGSFIRLLDVYSLLGAKSDYSRFLWDEIKSTFTESPSVRRYPFTKTLQDMCEDFTAIHRMPESATQKATLDHAAYILLFAASHLARYRPEIWKKIVEGEGKDTSMFTYRRVMAMTKEFYDKVTGSVILATRGVSPKATLETSVMTQAYALS